MIKNEKLRQKHFTGVVGVTGVLGGYGCLRVVPRGITVKRGLSGITGLRVVTGDYDWLRRVKGVTGGYR